MQINYQTEVNIRKKEEHIAEETKMLPSSCPWGYRLPNWYCPRKRDDIALPNPWMSTFSEG